MKPLQIRLLLFWLMAAGPLLAATNLLSPDEIPPLRPPRTELPPTFWEQYGAWPVVLGALVVLLSTLGLWLLLRPRPPQPVPPAVQAQHLLEPLRLQPETGPLLSRVSQIVRHYFAAAFGLPPAELTTTEFCQALAGTQQITPDLSTQVGDFLRQCDQRKFAPAPSLAPLGAAATAAGLIDQAEARRRAAAEAQKQSAATKLEGSPC